MPEPGYKVTTYDGNRYAQLAGITDFLNGDPEVMADVEYAYLAANHDGTNIDTLLFSTGAAGNGNDGGADSTQYRNIEYWRNSSIMLLHVVKKCFENMHLSEGNRYARKAGNDDLDGATLTTLAETEGDYLLENFDGTNADTLIFQTGAEGEADAGAYRDLEFWKQSAILYLHMLKRLLEKTQWDGNRFVPYNTNASGEDVDLSDPSALAVTEWESLFSSYDGTNLDALVFSTGAAGQGNNQGADATQYRTTKYWRNVCVVLMHIVHYGVEYAAILQELLNNADSLPPADPERQEGGDDESGDVNRGGVAQSLEIEQPPFDVPEFVPPKLPSDEDKDEKDDDYDIQAVLTQRFSPVTDKTYAFASGAHSRPTFVRHVVVTSGDKPAEEGTEEETDDD